jgi:hypothetical protein
MAICGQNPYPMEFLKVSYISVRGTVTVTHPRHGGSAPLPQRVLSTAIHCGDFCGDRRPTPA